MLTKEQYYVFDPIQFKEFGYYFFNKNDFYYRYQLSKKIFWKYIYIPYGPNCRTEKSFDDFLKHINSLKFTKITLDLPMIYNNQITKEVVSKLENCGFRKIPYIHQDEETIIILKNEFKLNSKRMNKVRHGYRFVDIAVKKELTGEEINNIYEIYLLSSKRIGFVPKNKNVFIKLSENCLVSLAYNKENKKIEGYVFGYIINSDQTIIESAKGKILLVMFTGLTDYGRNCRLGYALHYDLFDAAFENHNIDMIDFHSASRTKNRSYVAFKQDWGGGFYLLPGSFTKTFLL